MSKDKSFVIMESWLDSAQKRLNEEEMKEFIYGIAIYGLYGDEIECSEKVGMALDMVYPQIDKMSGAYNEIVAASQLGADKKRKAIPQRIWELARQGMKGPEIKGVLDSEIGGNISV